MPTTDGYARQKIFEALYALVGDGTIDRRLTFAADALLKLQPDQIPASIADDYAEVRKALTTTALSHDRGFTERQLDGEAGSRLARKILDMYLRLSGGL